MIKINQLARSIFCVIGGFLIHFSLGTIYTFGNIAPYISSYLKYKTDIPWITNGHMVWIYTIQVFFQGLMMAVGGLLARKIGARITCLVFCWIMSLGTAFTFFSIKLNLWMVMFTYGFLYGFGLGMAYAVAISTPIRWFPDKKGMITGIVSAGFGLGSVAFNPIQTRYINPLNISPNSTETLEKYFTDPRVLDNIPFCFVILGISYASIQLIGVILLTEAPKLKKARKSEQTTTVLSDIEEDIAEIMTDPRLTVDGEQNVSQPLHEFSLREALKDRRLYILGATFFFNGFAIISTASLYKSFGQTFISNDSFFSIVGAAGAFFNFSGRIMWGRLLDYFPYRIVMKVLIIMMCLFMGSFYFCAYIDSAIGVQVMYFMWVSFLFLCLAGSFAMFPTITAQCFGNKNMATILGIIFFCYGISGICGAILCNLLLQVIHYGGIFVIATASSIISLILTQTFPRKSKKLESTKKEKDYEIETEN